MSTQTIRAATFLDKGGTGKTTTAGHLGVALAQQGRNVLLIDLAGKQSDLAKYFGLYDDWQASIEADDEDDDTDWPNIATPFTDDWQRITNLQPDAAENMIHETGEGPDLIPGHPDLDGVDEMLGNVEDRDDRYSRLDAFVTGHLEPLGYDVILIDLPGLTNNVTYNGLWAAQNVIAPVEMGPLEEAQADQLKQDINKIGANFDVELSLSMVVPNKADTRRNLDEEYADRYASSFPDAIAPEIVPYSQDIRNACESGHTAFELEEPSTTAARAVNAYEQNANELITRLS